MARRAGRKTRARRLTTHQARTAHICPQRQRESSQGSPSPHDRGRTMTTQRNSIHDDPCRSVSIQSRPSHIDASSDDTALSMPSLAVPHRLIVAGPHTAPPLHGAPLPHTASPSRRVFASRREAPQSRATTLAYGITAPPCPWPIRTTRPTPSDYTARSTPLRRGTTRSQPCHHDQAAHPTVHPRSCPAVSALHDDARHPLPHRHSPHATAHPTPNQHSTDRPDDPPRAVLPRAPPCSRLIAP